MQQTFHLRGSIFRETQTWISDEVNIRKHVVWVSFGRGRANRGINYSYESGELLALHHVNKKSSKNSKLPNYKIRYKLFNSCFRYWFSTWSHMSPKLPKVKPTPQKKANSAKSLHPDGIEFNATLIRWAIWPCTRRWMWKDTIKVRTNTQTRDSSKVGFSRIS